MRVCACMCVCERTSSRRPSPPDPQGRTSQVWFLNSKDVAIDKRSDKQRARIHPPASNHRLNLNIATPSDSLIWMPDGPSLPIRYARRAIRQEKNEKGAHTHTDAFPGEANPKNPSSENVNRHATGIAAVEGSSVPSETADSFLFSRLKSVLTVSEAL